MAHDKLDVQGYYERYQSRDLLKPTYLLARLAQLHVKETSEGYLDHQQAAAYLNHRPVQFTQASLQMAFQAYLRSDTTNPIKTIPALVDAMPLLHRSLRFLSTYPFPSTIKPTTKGLSCQDMYCALAWSIPDRIANIGGNRSRCRSLADHRRALFLSFATPVSDDDISQSRLSSFPFNEMRWRQQAAERVWEFSDEELARWDNKKAMKDFYSDCVRCTRDDTGDEVFVDMVDLLCSTQKKGGNPIRRVHWLSFRDIGSKLVDSHQVPPLHKYILESKDLEKLIRGLLPLQSVLSLETERLPISAADDACVKSLMAAFETGGPGSGLGVNFEMFDRVLSKVAPALLRPYILFLGELLGNGFSNFKVPTKAMSKRAPFFSKAFPEDRILSISRLAQIRTIAFGMVCMCPEDFALIGVNFRPELQGYGDVNAAKKALVERLRGSQRATTILLRGKAKLSSWSAEGKGKQEDEEFIFGLHTHRSAAEDMISMEDPFPTTEDVKIATLFQLSPIQDAFAGVPGKPGWQLLGGGDGVVFGHPSAGASLSLDLVLGRATFRQTTGGDDYATVYMPSDWRGNRRVEIELDTVELWWDTWVEEEE